MPDIVTGGQDTVGLRVPNHPVALELLCLRWRRSSALCQPLRAHQPHHRRARARSWASASPDPRRRCLPGGPGIHHPRPVPRWAGDPAPRRHRRGMTSPGSSAAARACAVKNSSPMPRPASPVPLAAHYAPRTLPRTDCQRRAAHPCPQWRRRSGPSACARQPARWGELDRRPTDPAGLRPRPLRQPARPDESTCTRILVEAPPATPEWSAVADRLGRAAVGSGEDDET